ncbi:MAG: BolA family protein [bacterium]
MNMQSAIEDKLRALRPSVVRVENESHRHNVPPGSESHFKVTVVSARFVGERLLARHRMVNELLARELDSLHALALHTLTPDEWDARDAVADSPPCLGGSATESKSAASE